MHRLARWRWSWAVLALQCVSVPAVLPATAQTLEDVGVGLTPAHLPHQSDNDVEQMYAEAERLGRTAVIFVGWSDMASGAVATAMTLLARQHALRPIVELDILQAGGFKPAPPAGVAASQVFTPAMTDAYIASVRGLAGQRPDFLAVGTDINRLLAGGIESYVQFAQTYKQIYKLVKQLSPNTKVFVSFNWDIFANAAQNNHVPVTDLKKLVDLFRPELDILAFSAGPSERFAKPSDIPADYYEAVGSFSAGEPLLLTLGWPASNGGEAAQVAFVDRVSTLLRALPPALLARTTLIWPILHDVPMGPPQIASLGLYTTSGMAKAAAARFGELPRHVPLEAPTKQAADGGTLITPVAEPSRREPADTFKIYTNALLGTAATLVASDPRREINHARVSPDHAQVVFTRYNELNASGVAEETTSPWQTEVVICQLDGSHCQSVVPPRPGLAAGNAYWTPDGKRLIYFTNDRPSHKPGINLLDLVHHTTVTFIASDQIYLADPHMRDGLTVMAGTAQTGLRESRLYLTDAAGAGLRKLTEPAIANLRQMDPPLGDEDPKLSPDSRQVAFMRHLDKDDWAVFVVNVATGTEQDLSGPHPVDAVPEWSGDGKLLIFWHVGRNGSDQTGLYTIRPDGSQRRRVPLPADAFYTMPAFFPGSESQIIYSARPLPKPN